ncbi:MAG: homogentisate 1,2-dioxygenase [Candidatus Pelagibacter sp. TMED273]|nr:MAG: homogentisate 1,2-dioxygenase [Candidatus Pelagibacter sp. TMED273]|tara:strand:+ start:17094 stop:18239 length:1146 start_codon:yes stop_codon:yes gene_type:complete
MPFYQTKGLVSPKRHTVFKRSADSIFYEELVSREGFSSIYSNLYHLKMPTRVSKLGKLYPFKIKKINDKHQARHIKTQNIPNDGDIVYDRIPLLFNDDVIIHKAHVNQSMDNFYRNAHFDEVIYIQSGSGDLFTNFGQISIKMGDYIVIPRGVIWQLKVDNDIRCLVIESKSPIETPRRYRNNFGQLLEHSPFCERDIKTPDLLNPIDKEGSFKIDVRTNGGLQEMFYAHHPFDLVGWDGYYFPWVFNINDFEPITGSIHQPPPVHQTFTSKGFVICSFVSRMFDYHKDAIPAPYPHSNVDSDEVIFYSQGDFMSRKGIGLESITHHPMGLPHGPQPGRYEESIGKKRTEELAVMVDTFKPLNITENSLKIEDDKYYLSWL